MNANVTFPPPEPNLKLARPSAEKWAATLAEERRRLQEDMDALREREKNLREYEARLRALQAEIDASRDGKSGDTANPAAPKAVVSPLRTALQDEAALQSAWEKLHRARELLEAEQKNMRDDRIILRDQQTELKAREKAVAAREAVLAEREALVAAALPTTGSNPPVGAAASAVSMFTRAPFQMARSVFSSKK